MSQSFVKALEFVVEKIEKRIPENHVLIRFDKNNIVYEEGEKSEALKQPVYDIQQRMNKAIDEIEARRQMYKEKDLEDYGYDHYTQDFYYEPEEESEEE